MAKKIDVQKEPVKLREKVLKNGSISLFLDIYSVKGKVDFPQIGFEKGTTERGFQR